MKVVTALLSFLTVVWAQPAEALPLFNLMKQVGRGAIQSFVPLPSPADLAVDLLIENVQWPEPAPLDSPFGMGQGGNFVPELLEHVEEEPDDDADAIIDPQLVWVDPDDAL